MNETIAINNEVHAIVAAYRGRTMARQLGFSVIDQTALSTAIMEVARNISKYAGTGNIILEMIDENGRPGIRVTAQDCGPGIPDVSLALTDGYSTGHTLGLGLPGARRLSSAFEIDTSPGNGTTVRLVKWKSA